MVKIMSPSQCFFARLALRAFQLFSLLFVLSGIASFNALVVALESAAQGAISIPDLCWKILPVTAPLIPGLIAIAIAQFIIRNIRPTASDPNQPWLAKPMWASKHIRLSNAGLIWTIALATLAYVTVAVPMAIATQKTAIMVAIGVIGLVLFGISISFYRNRKWNTAELRMATLPGVIGGSFSGVAILQESFPPGTAFDVCLKCQQTKSHRSTDGNGSTSSTTETVWSSSLSIDKPLQPDGPNRTLIPFSFAIPFECEQTSMSSLSSSILTKWNLVVNERNKVGFGGAVFEIPVFRTPDSSPTFELDEALIEPFEQQADLESVLTRVQMKREDLPNGSKRYSFSNQDGRLVAAILLMSIVCIAILFACFRYVPNVYGAAFASLFPGVFLFAGLYTLLDTVLWGSSIEINQSELRCESGWLGFRKRLVANKLDEPVFLSEVDFRKQNGEWYRVELYLPSTTRDGVTSSGSSLTLVKKLDGKGEANAIVKWLQSVAAI
jgi:hypothetical protein